MSMLRKFGQKIVERIFVFRFIKTLNRAARGDNIGAAQALGKLQAPLQYRSVVLTCLGNCYLGARDHYLAQCAYTAARTCEEEALETGLLKRSNPDTNRYILGYCDYMTTWIAASEGDDTAAAALDAKFRALATLRPTRNLLRHYLPLPFPPAGN